MLALSSLSAIAARPAAFPSTSKASRPQRAQGVAVRASKINNDIQLDSDKVVDVIKASTIDGKCVLCRCWKSKTFPLCDGSHVAHNKAQGDNVGPVIVDNSS